MRIIFAGTPEIAAAVLQKLLDAKYNVIACLTQPDRPQGRGLKLTPSPVKQLALQHNIEVMQPQSLKDSIVQDELQYLQPDLMIVLAYGLILPQAVLDIPRYGCVNIHASILPRWRGAAPIQHAILAGDQQTGITIMQMDAGLDSGDILAIYPCTINANDTSATLMQRLTELAQTAIVDALQKLPSGSLHATPQNSTLATFAPKISKQQAQINWQHSAVEIDRCIRAYNPWPVAFTNFLDVTLRIWQAELVSTSYNATPGTVVAIDQQGAQVCCGTGTIRLSMLQFPGKKILAANEIRNAHPELKVGAVLF